MGLFGPPNVEKMKAKRDVKGLIKALGYQKDASVRRVAAAALGKIGDTHAVDPLVAALKDSEWKVREAAAGALGEIGDARAVAPLVAALKDTDSWYAAAKALVKIGAPAVAPLIAALKDSEWRVREAAAGALGKIGDARAVDPLVAALKDGNKGVRKATAGALDKMGWRPGQDESGARYCVIIENWNKCVETGAPAVAPLIAALLKDGVSYVRKAAAEALGKIGDARAVAPLIAALEDGEWHVGKEAPQALVKIGNPAVEPLIAALRYSGSRVRNEAAEALGEIGDARAVAPLIAALEDDEWRVREAAAHALDKMGWKPGQDESGARYCVIIENWNKCIEIGAPAVAPLVAVLKKTDWGLRDVRGAAAGALGQIGDARAVEPLMVALKDSETGVRQEAAGALVKIGNPAVEPLIAALEDSDSKMREAAAQALDKMGWKPGQDESSAVYRIVKRQWDECVEIGPPAVAPLVAVLKGSESGVLCRAVDALGQIGDSRAAGPLVAALKDGDSDVREAAAEALVKIGAPAVAPLMAALKDSSWKVREATAGTLGEIGDARAVEPLIAALKDSSDFVRKAAAQALDKMGWRPGQDESGAAYWVVKGGWDKCIEIGAPAVASLIAALGHLGKEKWSVRQAAAESLVKLYQSNLLDEAHKHLILVQRGRISVGHNDETTRDSSDCAGYLHTDNGGIGVAFPV